jgi:hypothetical protein
MESRKEKCMQGLHRYLVSFLLGAALIAPVGIQAKGASKLSMLHLLAATLGSGRE